MTVLEELIEAAVRACEHARQAGVSKHPRCSALLTESGKVFTGCDIASHGASDHSLASEKAAVAAALAEGESVFEVRDLRNHNQFHDHQFPHRR
jgi:cytidine deaminase